MKSHNYLRRSSGAVLGMIAASLIILFAIGAFLFYTGTLIGGNHELNRASDAGILSVAKQALVQPAIALNDPELLAFRSYTNSTGTWTCTGVPPYNDFAVGIADQTIGGVPAIDLLTYNRCAAQTILVCLNAQNLNLPNSRANAGALSWALVGLGKILQQRFATGALNGYYDNTANQNTLSMLGGGSTVNRVGNLSQGYVSAGRASNIFFYPDMVDPTNVVDLHQPSTALSAIPQNTSPADPKPNQTTAATNSSYFQPGEQVFYASGYTPIVMNLGAQGQALISLIPTNPQGQPHAVDQQRFDSNVITPDSGLLSWLPPNAFRAHSQAEVNIVGNNVAQKNTSAVNAISCAMIGCGDALSGFAGLSLPGAAGGPQDQAARIPGGFVRVVNLPGYEAGISQPLGPMPGTAGGTNNAIDGSTVVVNNSALGGGANVYIAEPIATVNNNGTDIVPSKIIVTNNAAGLTAIGKWALFNTAVHSPTDPGYNEDVVPTPLGPRHCILANDPMFISTGKSVAQYVAAFQNPTYPLLNEGPGLGQKAVMGDLIFLTGAYVTTRAALLDGSTAVPDSAGGTVSASVALQATVEVAGPNYGELPPTAINIPVPNDQRTWNAIEAMKYYVIKNWAAHFHEGHMLINIPAIGTAEPAIKTGMKYFKFLDSSSSDGLAHVSSPNQAMAQTQAQAAAATSAQFMKVATPSVLLSMIDTQIQNKGGYQPNQVTYNALIEAITNQVRFINPSFNQSNVLSALASANLAPGDTMYLRDDGNGNLIMSTTCPQDTNPSLPEATATNSTGLNQMVDFRTQPGQYETLLGSLVNTKANGTPTAERADAGLEQAPWLDSTGNIQYEEGAILYKSSGFGNCLGEVDLYGRLNGGGTNAAINVNFTHPN
jgi:hypothetical protein